jgi:D-beta-D-heptose 7-phosphate kinase/D-beta-D-heptose 1-phosphate adenosyltransferase
MAGSVRLAVVGDIMLDEYILSTPERISPEAPVPVARVKSKDYRLGGAANVAANVFALGADVVMFGLVGKDVSGDVLRSKVQDMGIDTRGIITDSSRLTTLKTRVVALPTRQQLLRLDKEDGKDVSEIRVGEVLRRLQDLGPFDALLVSDYRKGMVVPGLVEGIVGLLPGVPVLVDPKGEDFSLYRGALLVKPNRGEALALAPTVEEGVAEVFYQADCRWVLVTLGGDGMVLFCRDGSVDRFSAHAREVYDVLRGAHVFHVDREVNGLPHEGHGAVLGRGDAQRFFDGHVAV